MPTKNRNNTVVIAPSVLSADFSRLGAQIKESIRAGCPWIHLDIMDNHFVPNLTFGPPVVKSLRKVSSKAYFDAHLMTESPQTLIEPFAKAGVQNLTVHSEACGASLPDVLKEIHSQGMKAGVSVKPGTDLEQIQNVLGDLDLLLIMTVEPGFGGQALLPHCLNKIREAKKLREKHKYHYQIQADGGINADTAALVVAAGAEILVAGSAVFNSKPLAENVAAMMKSLK
jgi:ribulose-phosphate 3-epimerase